jgi:hypothetical protein
MSSCNSRHLAAFDVLSGLLIEIGLGTGGNKGIQIGERRVIIYSTSQQNPQVMVMILENLFFASIRFDRECIRMYQEIFDLKMKVKLENKTSSM